MTKEERGFLKAIEDAQTAVVHTEYTGRKTLKRKETAASKEARLVYADWLEEQGRRADAAKQRAKAGGSVVKYVGVNADGNEITNRYNAPGAVANLLRGGFTRWERRNQPKDQERREETYRIVMLEIRSFPIESRPLSEYKKK